VYSPGPGGRDLRLARLLQLRTATHTVFEEAPFLGASFAPDWQAKVGSAMYKDLVRHTLLILFFASNLSVTALAATNIEGKWQLAEVGGRLVQGSVRSPAPFFEIKGLTINGFDGCNSFSGQLDKPGSMTSTRIACGPDIIRLPLDLANPAAHLKDGKIAANRLTLPARGEFSASVYQRVDR
jgi:heat shock protein HslJ